MARRLPVPTAQRRRIRRLVRLSPFDAPPAVSFDAFAPVSFPAGVFFRRVPVRVVVINPRLGEAARG